ncbi:hypothetical protein BC835DRAFT_997044 [Cytidiella melzeri]|nr:hypothetical protein BC835DRAFT_997044 [Cytidiella melzeri]
MMGYDRAHETILIFRCFNFFGPMYTQKMKISLNYTVLFVDSLNFVKRPPTLGCRTLQPPCADQSVPHYFPYTSLRVARQRGSTRRRPRTATHISIAYSRRLRRSSSTVSETRPPPALFIFLTLRIRSARAYAAAFVQGRSGLYCLFSLNISLPRNNSLSSSSTAFLCSYSRRSFIDMHTRHNRRAKRQDSALPIVSGLGGVATVSPTAVPTGGLIISEGVTAVSAASEALPTLAPDFTLTTGESSPTSSIQPSQTQASSQALANSSSLPTSSVVAACIGSFIGLTLLICVFIWWTRHSSTNQSRGSPRSPISEHRNARGEVDKQVTHSGVWNKLSSEHGHQEITEEDSDEKNFSMFKKRTMSMRTTRTAKALEEHGFDMPSITKYHPDLARQLAQPERPFTQRQQSGVTWGDNDTVGDDSFLSLRSVRIESGKMSPTFGVAKMTPPAVASQQHKWESAEVLTLEESAEIENPFADVAVERRKSTSNPFFSARDIPRRRSRSNSRGHSHSRNASRSKRSPSRSRVVSQGSQGSEADPFSDLPGSPETMRDLPAFKRILSHSHTESSTSNGGNPMTEHAMKSLIAALDLTQEEVEERLRVASMQPSIESQYSTLIQDLEDDIAKALASSNLLLGPSSRY